MENQEKQPEEVIYPEVIWGSAQGAAHKMENRPCQDAVSVKAGTIQAKSYILSGVADGLGAAAHSKSAEGACFAMLAAEQSLVHFVCTTEARGEPIIPEQIAAVVQKNLCRFWNNQIQIARNQLDIRDHVIEYATTVLVTLIYDGIAYLFQLGDGNICYFERSGASVFLVPPEVSPVDESTDSLCRPVEYQQWHCAMIPIEQIGFIMMSTDGLLKSMIESDEYIKLGRQLDSYMEFHRPAELNARIPLWLDHYSIHGAGDDISLVAIKLKRESKGENHEAEKPEYRDDGKGCRGGTGRGVPSPRGWKQLCSKNVLRVSRHPGAEKYYLAPAVQRPSRISNCG